jgi:hypothetical protein
MPRRDFLFSLVILPLGLAVLVESFRMPRMEAAGSGGYTAPGIVPGIIGVALAVCATLLLIRSLRAGGWRINRGGLPEMRPVLSACRSAGIALGLITIYAVVLVNRIPFWLATLLFVFTFISCFEWQPGLRPALRARHLGTSLVQAVIVAAAVTFLFERVFLVQLPG